MTTNIALATRHTDGTTTRHSQAQELFDEAICPSFLERLAERLRGQYTAPLGAAAHCLRCERENRTDLPVCPVCIEAGVAPTYKAATCLACERKFLSPWDAPLPLTCQRTACVVKINEIATRLGQSV